MTAFKLYLHIKELYHIEIISYSNNLLSIDEG